MVSKSASVVGVLSGGNDMCVSTRAGGNVGLPTISFGDISGQGITINVTITKDHYETNTDPANVDVDTRPVNS